MIARDAEVAAVVAAGEADAGLRIRSGAAADDDGADGKADEEAGDGCGGSAGCGFTGEEISGARVADARGVEQVGREDVSFFEAEDLLAQRENVGAVGVGGGGGEVVAIVDGVDGGERIFLARKCDRREAVPKSSRMVCSGLLKTSAMPLKSGAPAGAMGQRFRSGCTLGTAAAREAASGTKAAEVWWRFWWKPS